MSSRKQAPQPMPEVGDYVVVAHQMVDPEFWWISKVEWTEADQVLVRDTQGWQPSHSPCLLQRSETILAFGTQEDCRKLASQARQIKDQFVIKIRDATVALQETQDAAREAIQAIVTEGEKRLFGDVQAIEP